MMDPLLKAQLERDEGRRLKAYKDSAPAANWTIGVGHLLGPGNQPPRMTVITDAECDALLVADVQIAEDSARGVLDPKNMWHITSGARQRALINMAFNRGEKHMRESTTISPAISVALVALGYDEAEKWAAVSDAILASPWAAQIGDRAKRLAEQLKTGVDQ